VRKLDSSLTVDVPRKELDRPSWVRVGVIAAVGFVIGVAWPKLAGVRLGPSAPGESASAAAAAGSSSAAARANDALPGTTTAASIAAPNATATASAPPVATADPKAAASVLAVKGGQITSCKTEDGESLKGKACGALGFDAVALPRLKRLATCPAAANADGKLSVMVHLDFAKSRVTSDIGKSSSVGTPDAFASCLKPALEGVSLASVAHDNPRYTVTYALHFTRDKANAAATPAASQAAKPAAPIAATPTASTPTATPAATPAAAQPTSTGTPAARPSEGTEIVWEVAIVRDAPKTGAVIARLPRGTKIQVGAPQDGWYKVKFDVAPNEGWVYRGSIGK
jgi:hypothetical protein